MVCARLMHKKNTSKDCDNIDNNNNNNNDINNNKTLMAVTITGKSRTSSLHCGPNVMLSVSVSSSALSSSSAATHHREHHPPILNYVYFLYREIARHTIGCRWFIYGCFKPICHWYLCEASITPALSWFKMLWVLYVIRITKLTHNFVVHRRTNVY